MDFASALQIGSGLTPVVLVWIGMTLKEISRDMKRMELLIHDHENRIRSVETGTFWRCKHEGA